MLSESIPQLIFGAASFGSSFGEAKDVQSVLNLLKSHNINHIDTAGRYPSTNFGRSEELLGEVNAAQQGFVIDTKIFAGTGDGSGELTRGKIEESLSTSLRRLNVDKVNTLHIHRPDPQTPMEEQAASIDVMHKEGRFHALGVSNFLPDTLCEFLSICQKNGFVKPTVYQGDYSMINRGMEKHLLPILREHGMAFNAYRSLASGFLSGSVTSGSKEGTRFAGDGAISQYMNKLYDNESLHNAQRKLAEAAVELDISPIEAALRWTMYHSALRDGDGIILGASNEAQIVSNLKSVANGPLPESVLAAVEEIWEALKGDKGDKYIY